MEGSDEALVVLTTAGSREEASALAGALVEGRLAACVQILPQMESVYRWEGRVERGGEWLLLYKTTRGRYAELERAILAMHSYTTPEVVAIPVERGSAAYLAWVTRETADAKE